MLYVIQYDKLSKINDRRLKRDRLIIHLNGQMFYSLGAWQQVREGFLVAVIWVISFSRYFYVRIMERKRIQAYVYVRQRRMMPYVLIA